MILTPAPAVFQHAYVLTSARTNATGGAAYAAFDVVLSVAMQIVLRNSTVAEDTVIIVLVLISVNASMHARLVEKWYNDR